MQIVSTVKLSEKHQTRLLEKYPQHQFSFFSHAEEVDEQSLQDGEVLITYGHVTPAFLKQMPHLRWIQVLSAGLEKLPQEELRKRNILVTNARGIHGIQMAEYTMGMILNLVRKNYELYEKQRGKIWDNRHRVDEAYEKTLGILGLGAIGSEIAKRAKAFGMRVLALRRQIAETPEYIDELISFDQQERLFAESDFLVVLLPATAATYHFIGQKELQLMKDSAYLINIARGQIIDEQALLASLEQKTIAGAVLDVFQTEPLPVDNSLWSLPNVIVTPHLAGSSPNYIRRGLKIFEKNLDCYPRVEEMCNVIDLEREY